MQSVSEIDAGAHKPCGTRHGDHNAKLTVCAARKISGGPLARNVRIPNILAGRVFNGPPNGGLRVDISAAGTRNIELANTDRHSYNGRTRILNRQARRARRRLLTETRPAHVVDRAAIIERCDDREQENHQTKMALN